MEKFYDRMGSRDEFIDFYKEIYEEKKELFKSKDWIKLYEKFYGESNLKFRDQIDWDSWKKLLIKQMGDRDIFDFDRVRREDIFKYKQLWEDKNYKIMDRKIKGLKADFMEKYELGR